jgi:hypothetical protein
MDAITALGHPSGTFESQRMDFLDGFFLRWICGFYSIASELLLPDLDSDLMTLGTFAAWRKGAMHYAQKNRSRLYYLITNLHVTNEIKLARWDCCGVAVSGVLVGLLAEIARLLLAVR